MSAQPSQSPMPSRKRRTEQAIQFAVQRRWSDAAAVNRTLLDEDPDDLESANRLGKALTELGDEAGALAAYEQALRIDPMNSIARKNVERLRQIVGAGRKRRTAARPSAAPQGRATLAATALIEESGRSAEFPLLRANTAALEDVSSGDPAELQPGDHGVSIVSEDGVVLGEIERRAGRRLARLIAGGNRYAVVIRQVGNGAANVYVRETYRSPEQADQVSFLHRPGTRSAPAVYSSSARYDMDEPPDMGDEDEEDDWAEEEEEEGEDTALARRGFSSASARDDDDDEEVDEEADDDGEEFDAEAEDDDEVLPAADGDEADEEVDFDEDFEDEDEDDEEDDAVEVDEDDEDR